jgi:hypothetical protein
MPKSLRRTESFDHKGKWVNDLGRPASQSLSRTRRVVLTTRHMLFHLYMESLETLLQHGDFTLITMTLMDKTKMKYEELKDKVKFTTGNGNKTQESEGNVVALRAVVTKFNRRDTVSNRNGSPRRDDYTQHRLSRLLLDAYLRLVHSPGLCITNLGNDFGLRDLQINHRSFLQLLWSN